MVTLVVDGVKMAFFFFFFPLPPFLQSKAERGKRAASLSVGRCSRLTRPSARRHRSCLIALPPGSTAGFLRHEEELRAVCYGTPASFFFFSFLFLSSSSAECQVVYWLPVSWLAASRANLTAGRWIVLNDESVCCCFFFFFYPPSSSSTSLSSTWKTDEQRHVEVAWQEQSSDCITQTEIAKLLFSPSRLFLLFPLLSSSPSLSAHFLPSSLCFLPVLSPNCSSSILP